MENVNAVVVMSGIAMVLAIIVFIKIYSASKKKEEIMDAHEEDVYEPVAYPGIPGIIPAAPTVVAIDDEDCGFDEDCCVDDECVCQDTQAPVKAPLLITIDSINRIKTKSREFLMDSNANLTKKEADEILNDISKPFDATDMDLSKAPFKYTVFG